MTKAQVSLYVVRSHLKSSGALQSNQANVGQVNVKAQVIWYLWQPSVEASWSPPQTASLSLLHLT
jgi:hypothetical protein